MTFISAFPNKIFSYTTAMPNVDIINCKKEGSTLLYLFALSMSGKSTIIGNINIFKDLNIGQQRLKKENSYWRKLFTIWWGNLKIEVQMFSVMP